MLKARVKVNPDVIAHYIYSSNTNPDDIPIKDLQDILDGKKQPTFDQLNKIGRKTGTPTGLLVLPTVVNLDTGRLQFRTVDSQPIKSMSNELRDTIKEMQSKQSFLHDETDDDLDFIGRFSQEEDPSLIANKIRSYLNLSCPLHGRTEQEVLNSVRSAISNIGIYVFFNGKVKDNTHRRLSINEFRGFVLSDSKSPVIFINSCDSKKGQLFTLIHETVHLFIGSEEIMEAVDYTSSEEAFVNRVTAEILMPLSRVKDNSIQDVESLASTYKVSQEVAVRRLYDAGRITKNAYRNYIAYLTDQYQKNSRKKETGGDYNKATSYRIDTRFFRTVENAVWSNRISHTEAFDLVGVGYKGYQAIAAGAKQ